MFYVAVGLLIVLFWIAVFLFCIGFILYVMNENFVSWSKKDMKTLNDNFVKWAENDIKRGKKNV